MTRLCPLRRSNAAVTTNSNGSAKTDLPSQTDLADSTSLANVYFLLARLWNHEVDDSTLRQMTSDEVAGAYRDAGGWLPADTKIDQALIDSLAIEYCQCFLGPKGHLPPHQSVVAVSRFQGDCCDSIKEYAKLIDAPNLFGKHNQRMVDHAAVLLAMMGKLYVDLQAAIDVGDDDAHRAIDSTRVEFYQRHVFWLIEYCKAASGRNRSCFFDGLFTVTRSVLTSELS